MFTLIQITKDCSDGNVELSYIGTYESVFDARYKMREEFEVAMAEEFEDSYPDGRPEDAHVGDWSATAPFRYVDYHLVIIDSDYNPYYEL